MLRPDAVLGLGAGGPREHGLLEVDPQPAAQFGQRRSRVAAQHRGVEHHGLLPRLHDRVEQFDLHLEAGVGERGVVESDRQRGQHLGGLAYEQDVAALAEEGPVQVDDVVGHLLEEHDGSVVGAEHDLRHHLLPVGVPGGEHLVPARVHPAGDA